MKAIWLLVYGVLISCQNLPAEKKEKGELNETEKTVPATADVTPIKDTELDIVDTLQGNETISTAVLPGRYIFISDKGNQFEFMVAGDNDVAEDFEEDGDNRPCDNTVFDGRTRVKVKTTAARSEVGIGVNARQLFEGLINARQHESLTFPENSREVIEQRNVEFKRVYIYAFSRQSDEDYHLVLGTGPTVASSFFFNAEISGPPPEANSFGRQSILKARRDFEAWFRIGGQCRTGYRNNDWRRTPVPVLIRGSLFYDSEHGGAAHRLGPQSWDGIKISSAWEIHPITQIIFER